MAPPDISGMHTLKVDNIPFDMNKHEVQDLFSKHGEIGDVYIPRSRDTGDSRGFAFVRFMEKKDAEDAMDAMEGHEIDGRTLRVQFAQQRRPDNPREYFESRSNDSRRRDDYRPSSRRRGRSRSYDRSRRRSPSPRRRSPSPRRHRRSRSSSYHRRSRSPSYSPRRR